MSRLLAVDSGDNVSVADRNNHAKVFGQPVISTQLQSQSVSVGANVTFQVSVADGVNSRGEAVAMGC
jgi:hypothetical protein